MTTLEAARTYWVHMELKGWNACHCRLPSFLGDRLNTRRRLVGFSLLSTIRCQTSWISPATEYVAIPPTMGAVTKWELYLCESIEKILLASLAKQKFSTQCLNKNTRKFVKLTSRRCAFPLSFLSPHASSLGNTIIRSLFQVLMSLSHPFSRTLVDLKVVCNIPSQGCGWVGLKNFRQQFFFWQIGGCFYKGVVLFSIGCSASLVGRQFNIA